VLRIFQAQDLSNLAQWEFKAEVLVSSHGLQAVSWCKNMFESPLLVLALKRNLSKKPSYVQILLAYPAQTESLVKSEEEECESSNVQIWALGQAEWKCVSQFDTKQPVLDVSWSPLNGRSYHMIAACGLNFLGVIYFFCDNGLVTTSNFLQINYEESLLANKQYFRIGWNIMATLLAVNDSSNNVELW